MSALLIERLEAAQVGSRELDAEIWLWFNRPEYTGGVKALELRGWADCRCHQILETDAGEEIVDSLGIGHFTTSLDAAMALAERLGWGVAYCLDAACQTTHKATPTAHIWNDEGKFTGHARTMQLALCIAILKAKDSKNDRSQILRGRNLSRYSRYRRA